MLAEWSAANLPDLCAVQDPFQGVAEDDDDGLVIADPEPRQPIDQASNQSSM